jgi:hypothetical protein
MMNPKKIIDEISKSCKHFFPESSFLLNHHNNFRYYIIGNNTSKAVNNYNDTQEEVDVIKWFDDFWLYAHVRFEKTGSVELNTFITISVFQGEADNKFKNQLFRAEWDNHANETTHPQPHWHIYSNQKLEKSFDDFVEMVDEDGGFAQMLKEEKKGVDVKKIHFSMVGLWASNGSDIHRIDDEKTIINWFQGILGRIKSQLEYAVG